MQPDAVVDVERRLDEGGLGYEAWVGKGLVVRDSDAIFGAVAVWTDDAGKY